MPSSHHQPNLFIGSRCRIYFAGDLAFMKYQESIRQRSHFFQFGRNQQDGTTGIPHLDNFSMDEFNGPDIHAACRL